MNKHTSKKIVAFHPFEYDSDTTSNSSSDGEEWMQPEVARLQRQEKFHWRRDKDGLLSGFGPRGLFPMNGGDGLDESL